MVEFYSFAVGVIVFHCVLLFFDTFFKSCSHYPYLCFLKNTGLQLSPFRIHWFTTAFNRLIQKWGTKRPRWQNAWFSAGAFVSIATLPLSVALVAYTIFASMRSTFNHESNILVIEPLVPGWNLPSSDYAVYLVTLLICSVIHEMGHAMAAVREDVHLVGFSAAIFVIIPFVVTHLDQLDCLPPSRKLRVLCAGVWHNIFLTLFAAILATTLPWILYPFYDFGNGVQIEDVKKESPMYGAGGLEIGDIITRVNSHSVLGISSWQESLVKILHEPNAGFCISDNFIKEHDESVPAKHISESFVECCEGNSPRHLCFEFVGDEDEPLPLPQHSCLLVRSVIDLGAEPCLKSSDCLESFHCFKPALENTTKLIRLHRSTGEPVLFLGSPAEVYYSIRATDFISLYPFFPSSIPDSLTKLCQFVTMFSSGLAVLNVIPCFFFDGQHIAATLVDLLLVKSVPLSSARHAISLCITTLGSLLLLVYLFAVGFSSL